MVKLVFELSVSILYFQCHFLPYQSFPHCERGLLFYKETKVKEKQTFKVVVVYSILLHTAF